MTKETYNKATELFGDIQILQAKIDSYDKALIEKTSGNTFSRDELMVKLENGDGKPSRTVFIPRKLVITMLNSAVGQYRAEIDKLQAELDEL